SRPRSLRAPAYLPGYPEGAFAILLVGPGKPKWKSWLKYKRRETAHPIASWRRMARNRWNGEDSACANESPVPVSNAHLQRTRAGWIWKSWPRSKLHPSILGSRLNSLWCLARVQVGVPPSLESKRFG